MWFVYFGPGRDRKQGKDRPALVVSSLFHLGITMGQLITLLPLTSIERTGWTHRVRIASGGGSVITEQVRTVSARGFRRNAPEITVTEDELADVRHVLARMLTVEVPGRPQ